MAGRAYVVTLLGISGIELFNPARKPENRAAERSIRGTAIVLVTYERDIPFEFLSVSLYIYGFQGEKFGFQR